MGINTMRKENRVISFLLAPSNKPADIVAPEREIPGITAIACAIPTKKADLFVIVLFEGL